MKTNYLLLISITIGLVATLLASLFLGIPTDIIDNKFYMRMIAASNVDLFIFIISSVLIGVYAGLVSYILINKRKELIPTWHPFSGTIGSFFAVSCPICIQFLVWIFGTAFLLKYYDPLRPFIGVFSIGLISFGIYNCIQIIMKKCNSCNQ